MLKGAGKKESEPKKRMVCTESSIAQAPIEKLGYGSDVDVTESGPTGPPSGSFRRKVQKKTKGMKLRQ